MSFKEVKSFLQNRAKKQDNMFEDPNARYTLEQQVFKNGHKNKSEIRCPEIVTSRKSGRKHTPNFQSPLSNRVLRPHKSQLKMDYDPSIEMRNRGHPCISQDLNLDHDEPRRPVVRKKLDDYFKLKNTFVKNQPIKRTPQNKEYQELVKKKQHDEALGINKYKAENKTYSKLQLGSGQYGLIDKQGRYRNKLKHRISPRRAKFRKKLNNMIMNMY
ncbi:unnamed protein product [Moneuplotes crassus]|uniref:Uncharacterized protein n=1 Tax=Euplotes crassus TaxID=5936 RepID=A0AAD2D350_EUPCR|nr:unnamed protein product [Moneuplotes crassus]